MDEKSKKQTTVNDLTYFYKMTKSSEYVHLCVCVCTEKLRNDSLSVWVTYESATVREKEKKITKNMQNVCEKSGLW